MFRKIWVGKVLNADANGLWYNIKNNWDQFPPTLKVEFHTQYDSEPHPKGSCELTTGGATANPNTVQPTTNNPATVAPTTNNPATIAPTTNNPATVAPTTNNPATIAPTTNNPTATVDPNSELPFE